MVCTDDVLFGWVDLVLIGLLPHIKVGDQLIAVL
jgi:hypothetical protein